MIGGEERSSPRPRRRFRPDGALILIPFAAMLAAGFWGLNRGGSMTNDEAATRWAATLLSWSKLMHLLHHVDLVHLVYYSSVHVWASVFGNSPESIRVPSVLAMALAALFVALLGRRVTGSTVVGASAGLVMAVTPEVNYYAQNARSYAFVFAAVTAATLALVVALEHDDDEAQTAWARYRWWVGYAALIVLVGYLNELAFVAVVAHLITLVWSRAPRRTQKRWLVSVVAAGVCLLPFVVLTARQSVAVSWIQAPTAAVFGTMFRALFGSPVVPGVLIALVFVLGVLHSAGILSRFATDDAPARDQYLNMNQVALPLAFAPSVLIIGESFVGKPLFDIRYVVYTESGVALLAGVGMAALGAWLQQRSRLLVWVPTIVVCGAVFALQYGAEVHQHRSGSRGPDYGDTAFYVADHSRAGDGIIFFNPYYRKIRLAYPYDFRRTADCLLARSPAAVGDFQGTEKPSFAVRSALLGYQRIWTIGPQPIAPKPAAGTLAKALTLLRSDYRVVAEKQPRGMLLRLWVRR